ncbi:unnamed protein product [Spodoptera exigua]|nr:unnamed protein product [Spodoptera exigua]
MSPPLGKNVKSITVAHTERKEDKKPREAIAQQLPQHSARPTESPTARANRLFQAAKAQLESSGNLKSTIKEGVLDSLSGLYGTVLQVDERLRSLELQLEQLRSEKEKELRKSVEEKDRVIEELARGMHKDIGVKIGELVTNTETIKKMINHDIMNRFDEYPPGRALCGNIKKLEGLMEEMKEVRKTSERTSKKWRKVQK